ncbi:hypothetical protein LCGC14_2124490, partial [marine sediment metagenome]
VVSSSVPAGADASALAGRLIVFSPAVCPDARGPWSMAEMVTYVDLVRGIPAG